MALQQYSSGQKLLQTEILWNKEPPVPADDALTFSLHPKLRFLLACPERRPQYTLGRNTDAKMG